MKCAECQRTPKDCVDYECSVCTKEVCCCVRVKKHPVYTFFNNVKNLYATALAIEVLCICAAEIGENSSFILFGYRTALGITMGYILVYCLAAFTTFATILGRFTYSNQMCGCCSEIDQGQNGFITALLK